MASIAVVARIKAKPEAADTVREELRRLIEPTRQQDAGCIVYDLHQDSEDASLFYFLERWESKTLLEKHLEAEHVKNYLKATEGLMEQFDLNILNPIG
jgi:quinol monooxygenase YgiN